MRDNCKRFTLRRECISITDPVRREEGSSAMPEKKNGFPLKVGSKVLIRTATYFQAGKVSRVIGDFVELTDASWIADTGRFTEAVKTGEFNEVEMFAAPVFVQISTIIDVTTLPKLPTSQK